MPGLARIVIAGDHHGVALKELLVERLTGRGHLVDDLGSYGQEAVDYPALCAAVGHRVSRGLADVGIILGGSGQGEVVACNKVRGIRAGLAYSRFAVEISRGNNDANVIVLGTKVVDDATAFELVDLWLSTPFKGGVHAERVAQIARLEELNGR